MKTMQNICFVCDGNTCRSPFAEKLLNKYLKQNKIAGFAVKSCGLNIDPSSNINKYMVEILKMHKINIKSRKPKKLTKKTIETTNLFITMTVYQKQFIDAKNVFSFGELVGGQDIIDPYGQSFDVYKQTANQIEQYIKILIDKIIKIKEKVW